MPFLGKLPVYGSLEISTYPIEEHSAFFFCVAVIPKNIKCGVHSEAKLVT